MKNLFRAARAELTARCGNTRAQKGIPLTEFLPDFARYRKGAPLLRNKQIVDYAEIVVALWDGASPGTKFVIDYCKAVGKPCLLRLIRR